MRINPQIDGMKRTSITLLINQGEGKGTEEEVVEIEDLVTDRRALIRPAQVVEGRLMASMSRLPMLVSQFERPMRARFG